MEATAESHYLETMSLESILRQLEEGCFTSELLVKTYIERIKEVNPIVNAISQLNPDAVAEAIEKDHQRRAGKIQGPLHGIPILLKDTLATLDSMDTTGGSFALVGSRPSFESTVVKKLRDAGAIILGKTNLSEFGYIRTPKAPNGWSPLYGQCTGAFCANQDPEGSSSGCAVAMSLGLGSATIGGETFGSITYPADRNGVVGLKPTVGLTSRAGVIPIYKYQDTVGPIVQTVKDAALLLQVMAGRDPLDEATNEIPFSEIPDYMAACRSDAFEGTKIAVPRSSIRADEDPEVLSSFDRALETIGSLGAAVIDNAEFPKWKASNKNRNPAYEAVLLREGLEEYFRSLDINPHNIHTMADLVRSIQNTPEEQYDTYGAELFENARDAKCTTSDEEFRQMKNEMFDYGEEIRRLLDNYDCEAMIVPTFTDIPYDLLGNPAISVPLGFYSSEVTISGSHGLVEKAPNIPYGLMFVGRRFSEEMLIGLAFAFEQTTNVARHRRLCVRPTSDLVLHETSAVGSRHSQFDEP